MHILTKKLKHRAKPFVQEKNERSNENGGKRHLKPLLPSLLLPHAFQSFYKAFTMLKSGVYVIQGCIEANSTLKPATCRGYDEFRPGTLQ